MAAPTTTTTTTAAALEITEDMTSCTPLQLAVRVAQLELEIARDAYAKFIVTELEHVMPPLASLREDLIKCMHASLASQWNGKISKLAAAASTVLSSCPVDITSMQLLLKGYSPDEMEKALKDGSSALNYRIFAMHVHGPDSDVVLEHMIQLDKYKHALTQCEQSLFQLHEQEARVDVAAIAVSNPRFVVDSTAASALATQLTGSYAEESRKRFQKRVAHCESIQFTTKRQCVDLTEEKQDDDDDVVPVHSPVKGRIIEFMHANKKFVQDAFIKQTSRPDAMACRTSGDTWALSQDQRERLGLVSSTLIRGLKSDPKVPLERFCVFLFGTAFTPNLVGLCSAAVYWTDPRDCIEVALKIKARLEDFVELSAKVAPSLTRKDDTNLNTMASLWRKKEEEKEEKPDVEGYYILNDALRLIAQYKGKVPAFDDPEDDQLLESFVSRLLGATCGIGLPLQDWSRLVQARLDENPLYVTKTDEDGSDTRVLVKEIPTSVVLHPAALVAAYRAVDMFPENDASMTTCLIERYETIGFKTVKKEVAKLNLTGVTMGNAWFGVEGAMKG